jgi:hypothetical protein
LPLPLEIRQQALGRDEARARLGMPAREVALLTIGQAYKYRPTSDRNFFRTLFEVLDHNPTAKLYLVGVSTDDLRSWQVPIHDRVSPLGVLSDPELYQSAADIYLEGFPYGSYTALMETVARGICPMLMYAPSPELDSSGDIALNGLVESAADEADYVSRLTGLINHPAKREKLGQAVAKQIGAVHRATGPVYLKSIYERLAESGHQVRVVAPQPNIETTDDLNLAAFNCKAARTGVLVQGASRAVTRLTVGDVFGILAMAVRLGDARLNWEEVSAWLGLLRLKIIYRPRWWPR